MKHLFKTTLFLLALLLPALATAHDFEVDGIYYNILNDNEVEVTYQGNDGWNHNSYSGEVMIPERITYNGSTYSVISIGEKAFYGCTGLTSINIPNSVTLIYYHAFSGCTGLTNIDIPNSVSSIGAYAFTGCSRLTTIEIPDSITSVGCDAFKDTPWYNNQPDGLVYIGLVAYSYKGDMPSGTSIIIKNGTLEIADCIFDGRVYLTNILIPNSVTYIGSYAFETTSLTRIEIPNSVTYIGGCAFSECSQLKEIEISNSVTIIDECAFFSCPSNTNVYCYATTPPICDNSTFNTYSSKTLHVPAASLAAYFTAPCWCNFENIVGDAVAPTGISISRDSVEANLSEQFELTATITPDNASNKNISWYSTDTTVATVADGIVTAVGFGECDIYAYCFGMPAICHVSVTQRISLDQQEASVLPNHILTLTPSALPTLPDLIVTSSDPTVAAARVMNGKVQIVGVAEGKTTITIGSANGLAVPATCLVTVYTEKGDVNMDGFVNISDVTRTISYVLGGDDTGFKFANADLNGDGRVTVSDVTALISRVLSNPE